MGSDAADETAQVVARLAAANRDCGFGLRTSSSLLAGRWRRRCPSLGDPTLARDRGRPRRVRDFLSW